MGQRGFTTIGSVLEWIRIRPRSPAGACETQVDLSHRASIQQVMNYRTVKAVSSNHRELIAES